MELSLTGGFMWLHYQQMGCLIQRVAKGLVRLQVTAQQLLFKSANRLACTLLTCSTNQLQVELDLPDGAKVAISGYNDFEWAVADFAVAVAGFVSVGVHTTYTAEEAVAVVKKASCSMFCLMDNLIEGSATGARGASPDQKWSLDAVVGRCPSLHACVVMDAPVQGRELLHGSFVEWVTSTEPGVFTDIDLEGTPLLDPFDARGAKFEMVDP